MGKRLLAVAVLITFASVSAPILPMSSASAGIFGSDRNKMRQEFAKLWQDREASYRAQFAILDAANKAAAGALLSRPFDFAPGDNRFAEWARATVKSNQLHGRGSTLANFLIHIASKPSPGLTRAWLQGQIDLLSSQQSEAQAASDALDRLTKASGTTRRQFLIAAEAAAMKRGNVLGTAEELLLLTENYKAYAEEFANAEARDADNSRRRAAIFGAIANSMRVQPGWTARCQAFGQTVTCSGN